MQAPFRRRLHTRLPFIKRIALGCVIGLVLLLVVVVYRIGQTYKLSPWLILNLPTGNPRNLKQFAGRTNILLLGISGGNRDGRDLTDTLMVTSLGLNKSDTLLISLPRDIWIPTLKDKINTAYHYGEEKVAGGGLILAKSAVEEVVGIPIHYAVLVDFEGFKKMVDVVGGIDVYVEETFSDPFYPIPGKEDDECGGDPEFLCRYETVSFTKGIEHMDGARALKYVRSRHATGGAGTDFSRGKRQQAVILALKNKVFTFKVLTNIKMMDLLLTAINEATTTDMLLGESLLVARVSLPSSDKFRTIAVTQDLPETEEKGLLINPPLWQYSGKWVLAPKHGDFSQTHKYIECEVSGNQDCNRFFE